MANLRVDLKEQLYDGLSVVFKAPCDCTSFEKIKVYYPSDAGTLDKTFVMRDTHGKVLSDIGNLFVSGTYVKMILDATNGFAYLQNADTNSYIEEQLNTITARMNKFTALPSGSTTGDAELADIRVAYDGESYSTAGEAVRGQCQKLHDEFFEQVADICNGENGVVYTTPGEAIRGQMAGKVSNPPKGKVGQMLEIDAVDSNGVPISYKAVDKPTGGSGNGAYRWSKFSVETSGDGEIVYTDADNVMTSYTAPSSRMLFANMTTENGLLKLNTPLSDIKSSADEMLANYSTYPYFYGDFGDGSYDSTIYKFKSITKTKSNNGILTSWGYSTQKIEMTGLTYSKGGYIETVSSDDEDAYPDNGFQGGYWYEKVSVSSASDVTFNNSDTGMSATNVQDAIVELMNYIGGDLLGGAS